MNQKYNFSLLCYDIIFKTIFGSNPNILAKIISDITKLPYSLLKDNLILETNELPISKTNEKAKRCDFIARLDKNTIINIELNRQSHTGLIIKNLSYIFKIFSTNFSKVKDYNKNFQVMQINFNCFKEERDNSIYTKNELFMSDEEALRLVEWEQNTIYNDGIDKGIEQTTNKTIISLLNKNMPLKDISEVTKKSLEEIKQI